MFPRKVRWMKFLVNIILKEIKRKRIILGIFPLQTTHNHLCQSVLIIN